MESEFDLVLEAEEFAITDPVISLATAIWKDPSVGRRFAEDRDATLIEFGIVLPRHLDLVPLGWGGRLGKPTPDYVPFEIRLSRCRTVVVRDADTGRPKTETVCFGIEVVPAHAPPPVG
ncbi:hypothetical protein GY21_18425 [Cryobacterium roopkundense]|uniref:Uncharacterized protein n=1 Tax=Cryobacterium roopkundense TaxID=1001240 RepID=A0A099J1G5_9MICO|nr:hypothetical protein [Cryobacterium roopkundense]KGJ71990.1 hypothetical protein GY21_18425 [Cryobacterium roopkundense]MBB5642123.1 hypothetical protein [Cryobacterium roopkundense]